MEKRRVLLVSQPNLFGESLEYILNSIDDVQVIGTCPPDDQVAGRCAAGAPDLIIITENELDFETGSRLTSQLLETFPNLVIIRIKQDSNYLLAYTSQTIPARVADLVEVIHRLPVPGIQSPPIQPPTGR